MNLNQYNIIMCLTTLTPHKICMYIVHVSTCTYTNKVIGVCTLFKSMDNFSEACAMTSKQETRVRLQLCPKTGTCYTCLASTVRYHSMTYTQSTKPTAMTHAEAVSRVWTAAIQVGVLSHLCFPKNYNNRATILIACVLYVTFVAKLLASAVHVYGLVWEPEIHHRAAFDYSFAYECLSPLHVIK